MTSQTTDAQALMKACQRGVAGKGPAIEAANNLLAECYGVLGKLAAENKGLRKTLSECIASLSGEMAQKFAGQKPEDMHPVTRRDYERDMTELAGYRAAMTKEAQP
ncbi:hypothetical protein [Pseudomonas hunanensis]|uniref:hypothetical protein n=1 Tax=Pseudomonas hunanensis TaxID=1247546 RepID=UPI002406D409|nr:hypothetical protein [Pseudomonas hunanensis]MDF9756742.1 hypothetical protein [Pseudomonas hunanensis]